MKHLLKLAFIVMAISFLVFCIAFTIAKILIPDNLDAYRSVVQEELEIFKSETGLCADFATE